MRNDLKLITTETFGDLSCNFYRNMNDDIHEIEIQKDVQDYEGLYQVSNLEAISSMTQAITTLTNNMITMQQDIQELKQSQRNRYLLEKRYPSAWYKKIAPKYKMLMEYFDCTRAELYSSIYKELEDTYNLDINQIHEDYCYENHLLKDECYPMDAIEHSTQLRDALALIIDSSLVKYGLQTEDEIKNFKRKTLFDTEPKCQE